MCSFAVAAWEAAQRRAERDREHLTGDGAHVNGGGMSGARVACGAILGIEHDQKHRDVWLLESWRSSTSFGLLEHVGWGGGRPRRRHATMLRTVSVSPAALMPCRRHRR